LRIGAPDRLSLPLLLPLLQRLRREAPGLALHLVTCDGEQALEHLDRDRLDLAIGWFDQPPKHLRTRHAFSEEFVCLCRSDHPLTMPGTAVDGARLLAHPHLVVSAAGGYLAAFDALLARRGQARRVALSVTNFSIVPHLLRDSDLVGVFTRRVAEALAREFTLACIPLAMGIEPLEHLLVWHGRNDADPRQRWLLEQVQATCAAA
jgi:DNA-binding transcriptional LysR family regulator